MNGLLNEAGEFACLVRKPSCGWFGESPEKGTPFIALVLEVADDSRRTIPWYGWLSEAAFDNTIRRLADVFGFDGDLASLHEGRQTLEGRACRITTEFEDYKDKQKCRVKWLNSAEGRNKPLDPGTIRDMTQRAKDIAGDQAGQNAPETNSESTEPDDVPF